MARLATYVALIALVPLVACSAPAGGGSGDPELEPACVDAPALPDGPSLDAFYAKYCVAEGLAIVASEQVPDEALQRARSLLAAMLDRVRPDAIAAIASADVRIGVIGVDQVTTDLPEHADLNEAFPGTDWDGSTRGVAATRARPLTSAAEENLLCLAADRYAGESILIHEFAHTVHELGVAQVDAGFDDRLRTAFDEAVAADLWDGTYAATNELEYWAEGVQSYFDANAEDDASHGPVDTRDELAAYDPALYAIVEEVFDDVPSPQLCP